MGRARGRRHGRGASKKGNNVWTIAIINRTVGTSTLSDDIVEDADWSLGAQSRTATISSIRGYLNFVPIITGTARIDGYFGVIDKDATSGAPGLAATYLDEDIMYSFGYDSVNEAVAGFDVNIHMDVKVTGSSRKIRTGQDCRVVLVSDVAAAWKVTGVLRAYMLLG